MREARTLPQLGSGTRTSVRAGCCALRVTTSVLRVGCSHTCDKARRRCCLHTSRGDPVGRVQRTVGVLHLRLHTCVLRARPNGVRVNLFARPGAVRYAHPPLAHPNPGAKPSVLCGGRPPWCCAPVTSVRSTLVLRTSVRRLLAQPRDPRSQPHRATREGRAALCWSRIRMSDPPRARPERHRRGLEAKVTPDLDFWVAEEPKPMCGWAP